MSPLALLRRIARAPAIALMMGTLVAHLTACGQGEVAPSTAPADIAGRYEVRGMTADRASPDKRRIEGTVILSREGDRYRATFELETLWPTEEGFTDAQVVGVGEGTIEGNTLTGTAQTQLVISSVPGVDTGFAFVPRIVTTRLVSSSVATVRPDGSITIDIENRGAEGEDYDATRTHMTGRRSDPRPGTPGPAGP